MEPIALGWFVLALLLGAGLGFLSAWLVRVRPLEMALVEARTRSELAEARARTGAEESGRLQRELEAAHERSRELETRLAALEAAERHVRAEGERLRQRTGELEGKLEAERRKVAELEAARREVEGRLEAERRAHAAKVEELGRMGRELEEKFTALADEVLGRNSARFLQLVSERFEVHRGEAEKELEARRRAIEELVRPVREALEKFERRVGELERAREGAYRAVVEQMRLLRESQERLRVETGRLVQALRRPQVRGRWGEFQLRNVVELAGMSEHVDYVTQTVTEDRLRPDAVIRLPGGKSVVVDVKTPLDAYLRAVEAEDEETREHELRQHARQIRGHVQKLARKEYWQGVVDAPDFVVLFVPGDPFYAAALQRDPELFEYALERKVLITTPSTFVALMKAIAYGWQQEKIAEGAARIAETARELHQRIRVFLGHVERLGKALGSAVDHYNKAVGSLESRVLPQARRFETLGAAPADRPLPEARPVELAPRALAAAADGDADGPSR